MNYIISHSEIKGKKFTTVSSSLNIQDYFGTISARWDLNRNNYNVKPGLYAVGNPDENSEVLVSANYKLSFDTLRKNLTSLNVWILVLDTKGINVWCAAGKGTFGTKELVSKINETGLSEIVLHRRLIVPQLGAPGISSHEVRKQSGFSVLWGPVRADDIKTFIDNGYKADEQMRTVFFQAKDRIKLTPVEIVVSLKYLILILSIVFLLSGISSNGYSIDTAWNNSFKTIISLCIAYTGGCVITPLLLPWIPVRSFSYKGLIVGLLLSSLLIIFNIMGNNMIEIAGITFMSTAISSFLAMNFTGTSTYTSLSGVLKEMKSALPVQISLGSLGIIFWVTARFISYNINF